MKRMMMIALALLAFAGCRQKDVRDFTVDVPALENRMRRSVHAMARRHFYNAVSPAEALPAYICLLEDETTNLRRLHEAFRFGMPAPEIDAMLIA